VIEEGAPADNLLYIVIGGEAVHSKKGRYPLSNRPLDFFGWVPVLDGSPSPVTVMDRTPLAVAVLDLTPRGGRGSPPRHIRNIVIAKLRHYSSSFARTSIADRVASLQQQAEFARYRNAVGSIVITALALLSFYTLALSFLPRFENDLAINFVLSPIFFLPGD
jgi:hypothetical protein